MCSNYTFCNFISMIMRIRTILRRSNTAVEMVWAMADVCNTYWSLKKNLMPCHAIQSHLTKPNPFSHHKCFITISKVPPVSSSFKEKWQNMKSKHYQLYTIKIIWTNFTKYWDIYEKQILIHKNFVALPFHPDTHVWSHPDFTESSIL